MVALWIVGMVTLLLAGAVGAGVLRAGRQLDRSSHAGEDGAPVAPEGSLAARVDASLERTRVAVTELVMPEPDADDLRPSASAVRDRAHTYTVVGAALLGMAVVLALGLLLLL